MYLSNYALNFSLDQNLAAIENVARFLCRDCFTYCYVYRFCTSIMEKTQRCIIDFWKTISGKVSRRTSCWKIVVYLSRISKLQDG